MQGQNKNRQLRSVNSRASKRRRPPRSGLSASARTSLPRDFDDWLHSEREQLIEKVLLSWRHPKYDRSDSGMIFKI
jgi:hypothetical protein